MDEYFLKDKPVIQDGQGALCPKCKETLRNRTPLMMGIKWECMRCDRRWVDNTYYYSK